MQKVAIGIDVGGTNTAFGFVNPKGEILYQHSIPTQTHANIEDFIKDLTVEITKGQQQISDEIEIVGMGIGAPNGNYYNGSIEEAPNLRWRGKIELVSLFKKHYNFPIFLTNDANAAALGEKVFGGAKGMNDFIVITLGTGLGSGIVTGGKMLYGHDGFAGELGHVIVKRDGRKCGCGRKGCLETYVSATGVVRTAAKMMSDRAEPSKLRELPYNEITSKKIYEAAQNNDSIALRTFNYTAKKLGQALADIISITSPEAIFVFGGLAKAGDLLLDKAHFYMEENLMKMFQNKVKLLPSQLSDNAAVLGAAAMAYSEIE